MPPGLVEHRSWWLAAADDEEQVGVGRVERDDAELGHVGAREPAQLLDVADSVQEAQERTKPRPVADDRAGEVPTWRWVESRRSSGAPGRIVGRRVTGSA